MTTFNRPHRRSASRAFAQTQRSGPPQYPPTGSHLQGKITSVKPFATRVIVAGDLNRAT